MDPAEQAEINRKLQENEMQSARIMTAVKAFEFENERSTGGGVDSAVATMQFRASTEEESKSSMELSEATSPRSQIGLGTFSMKPTPVIVDNSKTGQNPFSTENPLDTLFEPQTSASAIPDTPCQSSFQTIEVVDIITQGAHAADAFPEAP